MEHLGIQHLLERFSKKYKDGLFAREAIVAVVSMYSGKPLTTKEVSYKNNIIFLKVSPMVRTMILLKKAQIQQLLAERGVVVEDIR